MRLKCVDGKVRDFSPSGHTPFGLFAEARCNECGHIFGVYEFKEEKKRFKNHVCRETKVSPQGEDS